MQSKGKITYLAVFFIFSSLLNQALLAKDGESPSQKTIVVITDKKCEVCSCRQQEDFLRRIAGDVDFREIDYRQPQAREIIENLNIDTLPAFITDPALFESSQYRKIFFFRRQHLILRPSLGGIFLFLKRMRIPHKLDLFVGVSSEEYSKIVGNLEGLIKSGWKVDVHILGLSPSDKSYARVWAAIQSLYSRKFPKYTVQVLSAFRRIWWESDLEKLGFDIEKIEATTKSEKVRKVLLASQKLIEELGIKKSGVMLLNNRYIFSIADSGHRGVKIDELLKNFSDE